MLFKKKKYLGWKEYSKLLNAKEHFGFIQGTFRMSLKNEDWIKNEMS